MKVERGFMRSRVARRIVALFVLCALVPIAASALFSYSHARKLLLDQSYLHLAQLGEAYSSALYERLSSVSRILWDASANPTAASTPERQKRLRVQLDALEFLGADGKRVSLLGSVQPFTPFSGAESSFLEKGETVLRTRLAPDAPATISMAQAVDPRNLGAGIMIAAINPGFMWGETDALPAMTNFVVFAGDGTLLFQSQAGADALHAALELREQKTPNGRLIVAGGEEPEVASYRELFLESHFFVRGWTVVATRPESEVLAPIAAYKQTFVLATTLALLVIMLVSAAQIRRTLVPLERLIEGTRRAANKDFSTQVRVEGDDEFAELASSFNTMTSRLGQQFTALSTLAEIDRAILARPDVVLVIEAVLRRIRAIVPAQHTCIGIVDRDDPDAMLVYTRGRADSAAIDVLRVAGAANCGPGSGVPPEGAWLPADVAPPPFAALLLKQGAPAVFAVPIIWQGENIGVIGVGAIRAHALTDDEEARIRDLADRIGVAYSAAVKDEQLYFQAHYDALSKLPNRLFFKDQLERAIARTRRDREELSVLFVDLDYFKHVNDSAGHAAGDDVLVETAERLQRCLRSSDIVGRLGGDEFTILVTGVKSSGDARIVADNVMVAMARPFVVAGNEHFLSASVGIAVYPGDGATAEELLRNADTAMYRAKAAGRGQSVFFEERMNLAALERVRSERDLRHALDHNEFYLVYQPMLNLHTGQVSGAEALLRWNHPEHGLLAPMNFIRLAEETGLIDVLGEWVMREACGQFRTLQDARTPLPRISVNVSARQFRQSHFAETVRRVLRETGVPKTCLELEITESLLLDATPEVEETLRALSRSGVRIALDDFGTGYSSLAYLKRFPVNIVKIDRSFVKDLPADRSSAAITSAIISMAHALKIKVVAEGVATIEQSDFLRDLGCDFVQGYHHSKPLRAPELASFLRRRSQDGTGQDIPAPEFRLQKPPIRFAKQR